MRLYVVTHIISIHALREEGDARPCRAPLPSSNFYPRPPRGGRLREIDFVTQFQKFLSTPSARRATETEYKNWTGDGISIHALREEGDTRLFIFL